MLTLERLKQLFEYDPETGEFTRLVDRVSVKAGQLAGSLTAYGYLSIRIDKKPYFSHRLAWLYMTGSFPDGQIDHLNGVRTDNRWANLRDVSHLENHRNMGLSRRNKSGVVGVSWDSSRSLWQSAITVKGVAKSLGRYQSFDDAVEARKQAEIQYGFHENHGSRNAYMETACPA